MQSTALVLDFLNNYPEYVVRIFVNLHVFSSLFIKKKNILKK